MYNKLNLKYFLFIICLYLLIFQELLQNYIPIMKYFDEMLAIIVIPIFFLDLLKNKGKIRFEKSSGLLVLLMIALCVVGLYSNLKYNYQPMNIALSDMLLTLKFFLVYFLSKKWLNNGFFEKYKKNILFHIKLIIIVFFILTIMNYAFDLFPATYRYGIKANQLFFGHQTRLVAVCVFLYALYILLSKKIFSIYSIFLILMLVSTLRMKAIGFATISVIITIFCDLSNKKISFTKLGFVASVAAIVAYDQISYYFFSNDEFARAALTKTAINIAKDYFPVGTGFGTIGSYFSSVNYSPIYQMYGISNIWGLQKGNTSFVSDTFWPMILGQFGILGCIFYISMIIIIFIRVQKDYNIDNKYLYISKILCFSYLIISSVAESAFVNPISIPLALIIGINIKKNKEVCKY